MIKLILTCILLTGCAAGGIDGYFAAIDSVAIGDSYETMVNKMRYAPPSFHCLDSGPNENEYCSATYHLYATYQTFYFTNGRITDIGSGSTG